MFGLHLGSYLSAVWRNLPFWALSPPLPPLFIGAEFCCPSSSLFSCNKILWSEILRGPFLDVGDFVNVIWCWNFYLDVEEIVGFFSFIEWIFESHIVLVEGVQWLGAHLSRECEECVRGVGIPCVCRVFLFGNVLSSPLNFPVSCLW